MLNNKCRFFYNKYLCKYILFLYFKENIGGKKRMNKLKGALIIMKTLEIKPNFSALGRDYNIDYRTIRDAYNGKKKKKKGSFFDKYYEEIKDLYKIKGINKKSIYKWFKMNKKEKIIGYQSFTNYIRQRKEEFSEKSFKANVRYETEYGKQMQFDWKGPISLHKEKGKVESSNRFINWLKPYDYKIKDEDELKEIIKNIEKEYLKPLPRKQIIEYYIGSEMSAKVPNTLLVYILYPIKWTRNYVNGV